MLPTIRSDMVLLLEVMCRCWQSTEVLKMVMLPTDGSAKNEDAANRWPGLTNIIVDLDGPLPDALLVVGLRDSLPAQCTQSPVHTVHTVHVHMYSTCKTFLKGLYSKRFVSHFFVSNKGGS